MPNWNFNKLTFSSQNQEDINEIKSQLIKGGEFSFNNVIAQPQEVKDSEKVQSANPLWYSWNTENWGTKWDAQSVSIIEKSEQGYSKNWFTLEIRFDSAWCAPIPVIKAIYADYGNDISIEFESQDECGEYKIEIDDLGHYKEYHVAIFEEWLD